MSDETRYIETRAATVAYQVIGDGHPVALIQGLGMPGAMWREFGEELADHGFRAILVDNRGTGRTENRKPLFFMRDMADDVAAVLAREVPDEPAYAVGISMGGMIAQHLALRHPERLRGLVLAATTCGLPHNLLHGAFFKPQALALLLKLSFTPRQTRPEDVHQLLAHPDSAHRLPEIFGRIERVFAEHPTPPQTYARQLLAALLHNTGDRLPAIEHPARVVTGDADFLIPPKNSELLARKLPNARLMVVERAGHVFPMEHPGSLTGALLDLHAQVEQRG